MIIDVLVVAVLLISLLISFFRGFIREILTIFGLFGAALAALIFSPIVEPMIAGFFVSAEGEEVEKFMGFLPYPLFAKLLSYGGIFLIFMVVLSLLSHFLSDAAEKVGLGSLDRSLGALFGLVRGILLIGLLYLPFHYILDDNQKESWLGKAMTYPYLEWTAKTIGGFIPSDTDEAVDEKKEKTISNVERLLKGAKILKDSKENGEINASSSAPSDEKSPAYGKDVRENLNKLIEDFEDKE